MKRCFICKKAPAVGEVDGMDHSFVADEGRCVDCAIKVVTASITARSGYLGALYRHRDLMASGSPSGEPT